MCRAAVVRDHKLEKSLVARPEHDVSRTSAVTVEGVSSSLPCVKAALICGAARYQVYRSLRCNRTA